MIGRGSNTSFALWPVSKQQGLKHIHHLSDIAHISDIAADPGRAAAWIQPDNRQPLTFHAVGQSQPLTMVPLYKVIRERYVVYWKVSQKSAKQITPGRILYITYATRQGIPRFLRNRRAADRMKKCTGCSLRTGILFFCGLLLYSRLPYTPRGEVEPGRPSLRSRPTAT